MKVDKPVVFNYEKYVQLQRCLADITEKWNRAYERMRELEAENEMLKGTLGENRGTAKGGCNQ